jgi:uncharacterized damage-inducible protein DinB
MVPEHVRRYLLHGLAGTPIVVDRLMAAATPADLDRRPDPERFTLREVMAHLADWEPIWQERLERVRSEESPALPSIDEGQMAIDRDYARSNPTEQQTRFRDGRATLLRLLHDLAPEEWDRTGRHSAWGTLTTAEIAALILGHDGYHLRQIAEWLESRS